MGKDIKTERKKRKNDSKLRKDKIIIGEYERFASRLKRTYPLGEKK